MELGKFLVGQIIYSSAEGVAMLFAGQYK